MVRKATEGEIKEVNQMIQAAGSSRKLSASDVIVGRSPLLVCRGSQERLKKEIIEAGIDPKNPSLVCFMKPRLPNKTIFWRLMIGSARKWGSLIYEKESFIPRALIKCRSDS